MKNILAFGDSNTWGLIPGTKERYLWGDRWTSLVEERLSDTRVIEEGLCGRTTVFEDELRPLRRAIDVLPMVLESKGELDAVIIMLGTNDCKTLFHSSPYTIGKGMERCLDEIEKVIPSEKVLVVSPIHLGDNVWEADKDPEFDVRSVETSKGLKDVYRNISARHKTRFLAASDYAEPSHIDEEHMDKEGHRRLADAIVEKLEEMAI